MPVERYTDKLIVMVKPSQKKQIEQNADDAGYEVSEYVRLKVCDDKPKRRKPTGGDLVLIQARELLQQLVKNTESIDQQIHAGQTVPSQIQQWMRQDIAEVSKLLKSFKNDNQGQV